MGSGRNAEGSVARNRIHPFLDLLTQFTPANRFTEGSGAAGPTQRLAWTRNCFLLPVYFGLELGQDPQDFEDFRNHIDTYYTYKRGKRSLTVSSRPIEGRDGKCHALPLAQRGKRVIGLERYDIPNDMGSSHGECQRT